MAWLVIQLLYEQPTPFTGIESVQIVVQDLEGVYSDVITLKIVMVEMPCLHGGTCFGRFYKCFDFY